MLTIISGPAASMLGNVGGRACEKRWRSRYGQWTARLRRRRCESAVKDSVPSPRGRMLDEGEGAWTRWEMVVMNTEATGCLNACRRREHARWGERLARHVGERS
jgi:hypothetical protein